MNRGNNNKNKFFRGRGRWFYNKNRGRGRGGGGNDGGDNRNQMLPLGNNSQNNSNSQNNNTTVNTPSVKQSKITSFVISDSPYPGWRLYYPDESYINGSNTDEKVKTVEQFINNNLHLFSITSIQETKKFSIDLKVLKNDENFKTSWKDFENDLRDNPSNTVNCIGLAMHQVVCLKIVEEDKKDLPDGQEPPEVNLPMIHARIINFEPVMQLKHLKSNYYGKMVSVKGTIIRIGNIKLMNTWMTFQCNACETLQCVKQPEGVYTLPTSCKGEGCKCRTFTHLLSSPFTQTVNWQCVRLQEIVADEQRENGRVPRTIECELTADLVDSCSPGDVVTLTGKVKIRDGEENRKKKSANVFLLYLDVVSVVNSQSVPGAGKAAIEFNLKDYYAIKEIHSENKLFRLIVQSLCPQIYGHEVVKAGLILCMFGGCQRYQDCRADPHILIVGDPGLGKSRMLQACTNVSPRGVYVCGNTSTSSGLTVTLNREGGGDYTLEAGALVLSDQGCCCIDEFDKMTTQHQALLEAMEQQTISIAKAGVVCSLPARTSILAAANPVGGHYNKAKTVSENLKLGPALLSRFDLVFILLDQPNQHLDSMLSEHVMALHSGVKANINVLNGSFQASFSGNVETIQQRLKVFPGEELDIIPHQLLRKYIAYARKYVKPSISPEAANILQKFYLELRKHHKDNDCTPVTTRQLESLIRLTEARAKAELRTEATEADAMDVIEIFKLSMIDTFSDQFGAIDFSRSQHGSGTSSKNQAKKFVSVLQKRAELQSRSVFSVQELKEVAQNAAIVVADFSNFLATLNIQGYLLKKGSQLYQLLSVDY